MSLPVICYRVATGADAGQMAAVQIAAWRDSFAGFVPQQLLLALDHPLLATALQSQLIGDDGQVICFVASYQGRIIGWCHGSRAGYSDHPNSAEINTLVVDPDFQDQGIGTALFLRSVDCLCDLGFDGLVVKTWTENRVAMSMFGKLGATIYDHPLPVGHAPNLQCRHYIWANIDQLFDRLDALVANAAGQ